MKKNTRYGPDLVGPAERKEKNKVTLGPHHGLRPRTMEQWVGWFAGCCLRRPTLSLELGQGEGVVNARLTRWSGSR